MLHKLPNAVVTGEEQNISQISLIVNPLVTLHVHPIPLLGLGQGRTVALQLSLIVLPVLLGCAAQQPASQGEGLPPRGGGQPG